MLSHHLKVEFRRWHESVLDVDAWDIYQKKTFWVKILLISLFFLSSTFTDTDSAESISSNRKGRARRLRLGWSTRILLSIWKFSTFGKCVLVINLRVRRELWNYVIRFRKFSLHVENIETSSTLQDIASDECVNCGKSDTRVSSLKNTYNNDSSQFA